MKNLKKRIVSAFIAMVLAVSVMVMPASAGNGSGSISFTYTSGVKLSYSLNVSRYLSQSYSDVNYSAPQVSNVATSLTAVYYDGNLLKEVTKSSSDSRNYSSGVTASVSCSKNPGFTMLEANSSHSATISSETKTGSLFVLI